MPRKDHSAVKFQVAEALGEWMNVLFLKGLTDDEEYQARFIHHMEADGMSAIKMIAEDEGLKVNSLPGLKSKSEPLFKIGALLRYIKLTKKVNLSWLYKRKDQTGIPKHFVLARIQGQNLQALYDKAKAMGVSPNSIMITALDQATKSHLLGQDSARKWILPLNMRPQEKAHLINGNYSASIILNYKENHHYTSQETHQMIKSYLKNNIHWGSFLYSNMARFIGFKGTLKVARSIKEVGTGVFSNLGAWPGPYLEGESDVKWRAVVAPSTQILPVAATAWHWKETLSLTLQLHPSLNLPNEHMATQVMDEWLKLMGLKEGHKQVIAWSEFPNAPKTP